MSAAKSKIAILGGGVGGITTAWALTSQPGWQDRFDITLYQLGWRIGGKGASGRNPDVCQRIEEHGLHIWLGFYDNAFAAMQACYAELGRPAGAPLARWDEAFRKHSEVGYMEHLGGSWLPWMFHFPENEWVPGSSEAPPFPAVWTYARKLVEWILGHLRTLPIPATAGQPGAASLRQHDWIATTFAELGHDYQAVVGELEGLGLEAGAAMGHLAARLVASLDDDVRRHTSAQHQALGRLLEELVEWLDHKLAQDVESSAVLRRGYILIGLAAAIVGGMIDDGVPFHGFEAIERQEFSRWLKRHGATDAMVASPPVRGLYDLVFGFERGKLERPNLGAGTALRSICSILLDYRGAVFWKMQAGMGDTVFGPFYEVLRRRGVRFAFFHKVENLGLSEDGCHVETIRVARQVWLNGERPADGGAPADVTYEPLVDVGGLPCWPSVPRWEQLDPRQAAELCARGVDLESYYADWTPAEVRTLARGRDFDAVVLAIPPGAHRLVAPELLARHPRWEAMVTNVQTVQTRAMQLWLRPPLAELGWEGPSPVVDAFADPLNTWADMSHLIAREAWPEGAVGSIAYFCGPLEDSTDPAPPAPPMPGFPARRLAGATEDAIAWTAGSVHWLWPRSMPAGDTGGFDWELLAAPDASLQGLARARAQYYRVNVEPTERYVLSLAGSAAHRLRADGSGIDNLVLAGDWTHNGFLDAGCVEAGVISGLQAARALDGIPRIIPGEPGGFWPPRGPAGG